MPNALLEARLAWEAGDRPTGFRILNDHLEEQLDRPVFLSSKQLLHGEFCANFFMALLKMTCDNSLLISPFAPVFVEIWRMFPHQPAIDILRSRTFTCIQHPASSNSDLESGVNQIAQVLLRAGEEGTLSGDPAEMPNGGRPVLAPQWIDSIDDAHWGSLKPLLLNQLPVAYARCPRDAWCRLAATVPAKCVACFLHELFVVYSHSVENADLRWAIMQGEFPDYAGSVQASLVSVLAQKNNRPPEWYTSLVRIDAGFVGVQDGYRWLKTLAEALASSNFGDLRSVA